MALNIAVKFEGKLTCLENDVKNLENFYKSTRKSKLGL